MVSFSRETCNISQTGQDRTKVTIDKHKQESLADAKVNARQHSCIKAPSEEICSKSTICDFLLMVNSNRGRNTYGLRDIFGGVEVESRHFRPLYYNCRPLAEERPAIST